MSEREVRVGRNEALFRTINEKVRDLNTTLATYSDVMMIACECADLACVQEIEIDPERYADVRADDTLFIIRPGHEAPDTEAVVAREETFWVVRKHPGLAEAIARETAPSS